MPIVFMSMTMLMELIMVITLGILSAGFLMSLIGSDDYIPSSLADFKQVSQSFQPTDLKPSSPSGYDHLLSYDPFFGALMTVHSVPVAEAPESSLKIAVFGLRFRRGGNSSVIVKVQGLDQVRAVVGDNISSNVRLVGIYEDRIEITRNGARESVYFQIGSGHRIKSVFAGNAENRNNAPQAVTYPSTPNSGREIMTNLIKNLDLNILKSGRKTDGFVIGDGANKIFLTSLKLETGDLLVSVNGESLSSYEKLEELPDEINGASQLDIELVRRGVAKRHVVPLGHLTGK